MNTSIANNRFAKEIKESLSTAFTSTRHKIISAADVWNIQRQKRTRVQRKLLVL